MPLVVDLLTMDAARIDVARIQGEFSDATERSDTLADAVGHPALAERVQEFVDNWDHRRGELAAQLGVVHDHLQMIVSGFEQTDQDLARALTEQRTSYPTLTAPERV